jgi:hypothetical protein
MSRQYIGDFFGPVAAGATHQRVASSKPVVPHTPHPLATRLIPMHGSYDDNWLLGTILGAAYMGILSVGFYLILSRSR